MRSHRCFLGVIFSSFLAGLLIDPLPSWSQSACLTQYNQCSSSVSNGYNSCVSNAQSAPQQYQPQLIAQCQSSSNAGQAACQQTYDNCGTQVAAYLKFVVVGVLYAPPGSQSTVTYTSGSAQSLTSSTLSSFGDTVQSSLTLTKGFGIAKVAQGSVSTTVSTSFTQTQVSSTSLVIAKSQSKSFTVRGPSDSFHPVNHDQDLILVWLNPVSLYTIYDSNSSKISWNGYGFDAADGPDLDIAAIPLGYLNGDFGPMPTMYGTARSWATNQQYPSGVSASLTQADFAEIASIDPFNSSNRYSFGLAPNTNPATTTDGRFTLAGGSTPSDVNYYQAAPGGQPTTTDYTTTYSTTSTLGQSASTSMSNSVGVDISVGSTSPVSYFKADLKTSNTITVAYTANASFSSTTSQSASYSITGVPCNTPTSPCVPTYSGPSRFAVYQDNIFGTFLFEPY